MLIVIQPTNEGWSTRLWSEIEPTFAAILVPPVRHRPARRHPRYRRVRPVRRPGRALSAGLRARTGDRRRQGPHPGRHGDVRAACSRGARRRTGAARLAAARRSDWTPRRSTEPRSRPPPRAYTSYLLATAYGGSFAEGLAAVLPCYWIYARVGAALAQGGSTDLATNCWIDSYGGEEFAATVAEVLALTDRVGLTLSASEEAVARAHFATTSRYEWMFFDAAHRRETWPV